MQWSILISRGCLILLLMACLSRQGSAQHPYSKRFNYMQGLPSDVIYDLHTDPAGYVLLATEKGLYRYNGISFEKIPFDRHKSNAVSSICTDRQNNIWCRNFSNQVFFMRNDTMRVLPGLDDWLRNETVNDIKIYQNSLFIITFSRIIRYQDACFELFFASEGIDGCDVNQQGQVITADVLGNIFIINQNKEVQKIACPWSPKRVLLTVRNQELFVTSKQQDDGRIYRLANNRIVPYLQYNKLRDNFINGLIFCNNYLAVCSNAGVFLLDEHKKKLHLEAASRISDIVSDFQGNYWISTLDNGLIMIPSMDVYFLYENQSEQKISCVADMNGRIVAGTNKGLIFEFDTSGKLISTRDCKNNNEIEFIGYDSLRQTLYCSAGHFDAAGQFYPFYYGKGISLDSAGNVFFAISSAACIEYRQPTAFVKNFSFLLHHDAHRWLCFLRNHRSRSVYFDRQRNELYVGFADDLYCYGPDGGFRIIKDKEGNSIYATHMLQDPGGRLWISTTQSGVLVFRHQQLLAHYSTRNQLSGNICKRLMYNQGFVYVLTDNGIDRIDVDKQQVTCLSNQTGVNNLHWLDIRQAARGFYAVCNKGLLFFPYQSRQPPAQPRLFLTTTPGQQYGLENPVALAYHQNRIEFGWQLLSFRQGVSTGLAYRLLPINTAYSAVKADINNVVFNALPYGDYVFELRAAGGQVYTSYRFSINKPFWLNWWFIVLELLAGAGLLYLTMRLSQARTKRKQLFREQLILSQLTALRSQMNPHFVYNVLNSIQGLVYGGKKEEAAEQIALFSDMMRKVLDVSSRQYIKLRDEVEMLRLYIEMEKLRMKDLIYEINIDKNIDILKVGIPSMIIQPIVENALKHGLYHKSGEKKLIIAILENPAHNCIEISVDDNGIGRQASAAINRKRKHHTSFASNAIDSRISLFQKLGTVNIQLEIADKFDADQQACGTKVKVILRKIKNDE